jgi:hypothetical protein
MPWKKLKKSLQAMPAAGPGGFEGLAARFLELILKETFILARSGDQPSGDAHNVKRNICLQAKRYAETTPNAKNIEGDFDANIRALPETDVYVLAITKNTAQIDDTLNAMRDKSGVDLIVWDFDDENSDLSVLCVEFWDQLQSFDCISAMDTELKSWITASRQTSRHKSKVEQLGKNLQYCTQTFAATQKAAQSFLKERFTPTSGGNQLVSYPIELEKSVRRTDYTNKVMQWWETAKERAITLIGEEGMGKSWLAAQCADRVAQQSDALVLWLDSLYWRNHQSLEQVLVEVVSRLRIGDENKVFRIVRKIRSQWSAKTLIVLDGVNERGAINAAQQILDDLVSKGRGKCRLLFTTRPLNTVTGYEPAIWKRWTEIPVNRFDDPELTAALSSIVPPIEITEIPERLASFARIPRYFQTCVRLRDRLKSFTNISLSLVLWTDLLDKISGLEPQLKEKLGWSGEQDAVEVLVELAISSPGDTEVGIAQDLLNRCFGGKYAEIRHYLREVRILQDAGTLAATLNPAHTVLGKALFLRELLRGLPDTAVSEISDRLKRALEPMVGEDGAAEALFVALQLSAIQDTASSLVLTKQRAALLHAWIFSHNSNATDERLGFWAQHDVSTYATLTETFFEDVYESNAQLFVVKPLATVWKKGMDQAEALKQYLKRWLLLVWSNECSNTSQYEYKGHHLPVASTRQQVRLTAIALSIISLRPDNSILSDLALCHATDSLSWDSHRTPDGKEHKYPFKSVENNIGILMRWSYTETIMPELLRLANDNSKDELMLKGLQWLAKILRTVEIPSILQLPPDIRQWPYFGCSAIELIRKQQRLFVPRLEGKPFLGERDFSYLAVRVDLPMLADEDISFITDGVEKMCSEAIMTNDAGRILDHHQLKEWWPWYAKFKPKNIAILAGQLQLFSIKQAHPYSLFSFLQTMPFVLPANDRAEWLKVAGTRFEDRPKSFREIDHVATMVSESSLLSMPEDILHNWIVNAESNGTLKAGMFFDPISDLLSLLMPQITAQFAIDRCRETINPTFGPIGGPASGFEYWCYLASLSARPDPNLFEWAKELLLKTQPPNERSFSLLRLWLRSALPGYLESTINDNNEECLFSHNALRAWAFDGDWPLDFKVITAPYEQILRRLPKGFAGTVFFRSARNADLKRWGDELFGLAMSNLSKSPIDRQSRGKTELIMGRNHKLQSVGFDYDFGRPRSYTTNVSSWGIEYASKGNLLQKREDLEELYNQEFEKWRLDETAMENWEESDLHFFGAWAALEAYRKLDPDQFAVRVRILLNTAENSLNAQYHIGGFLHAAVTSLLPNSPAEAWQYFNALNSGSLGIHVTSSFDIPEFYVSLWNINACILPEHKQLRIHYFEECENEFEIMVLTIAALANNAMKELLEIVDQFLLNKLAKNRALGVSILAWIGNRESIQLLEELISNDYSDWVRRHAQWAIEICLQEQNARDHYRKTLHESDPYLISGALQVLEPALTPVARWWHYNIRCDEEKAGLALEPRSAAVIESFWHHWKSVHSSSISVAGKKLDEFCRGEHLDVLKTPRIAPWWNL